MAKDLTLEDTVRKFVERARADAYQDGWEACRKAIMAAAWNAETPTVAPPANALKRAPAGTVVALIRELLERKETMSGLDNDVPPGFIRLRFWNALITDEREIGTRIFALSAIVAIHDELAINPAHWPKAPEGVYGVDIGRNNYWLVEGERDRLLEALASWWISISSRVTYQ